MVLLKVDRREGRKGASWLSKSFKTRRGCWTPRLEDVPRFLVSCRPTQLKIVLHMPEEMQSDQTRSRWSEGNLMDEEFCQDYGLS